MTYNVFGGTLKLTQSTIVCTLEVRLPSYVLTRGYVYILITVHVPV